MLLAIPCYELTSFHVKSGNAINLNLIDCYWNSDPPQFGATKLLFNLAENRNLNGIFERWQNDWNTLTDSYNHFSNTYWYEDYATSAKLRSVYHHVQLVLSHYRHKNGVRRRMRNKNKVIINFKVFVILTRVNFVDADRLIYDQMVLVSSALKS